MNQLRSRYAVQEVRVKSLQAALADEQYLLSIGGGTKENVKKAELDLKVAILELSQLQRQIKDEQEAARIGMKDVGFELEMNRRDIGQLQRQLEGRRKSHPQGCGHLGKRRDWRHRQRR